MNIKIISMIIKGAICFVCLFVLSNCDRSQEQIYQINEPIRYTGLRSSWYGIDYDFTNEQWRTMSQNLASFFPANPQTTHIWIVGGLLTPGVCDLEFTKPGSKTYNNITFTPNKKLNHEQMLTYFDAHGITVYLQVEPGMASIDTLIDLVLNQYKHHPCVIGFGVDVEWFMVDSTVPNETVPVTDSLAKQWEQNIKTHNPAYKLFLKHWEHTIMPPYYRGKIVFINDSQGFSSLNDMTSEFSGWANYFAPGPVMFQVGYYADYNWWKNLANPPKAIGEAIAQKITTDGQAVGIIWVDFTLNPVKYPELEELFAKGF